MKPPLAHACRGCIPWNGLLLADDSTQGSFSGLSGGAIAGIVTGVLAGVAL
uniref:Uncharacterized protein n=1 Tax=Phocoena sinus TaxID=42100 RepID=A0A8C9CFB0_PHOSS